MRLLVFVGLALLLLSIESVAVNFLGLHVARIDVCLALVVYAALRVTAAKGAFTAFIIGYLLDVFTGRPTWLYAFLAVLIFLLVRGVGQLVDWRSRSVYAFLVAAATFVHAFLAMFFGWLTSQHGVGSAYSSLPGVPLQVLLSTVVAALLWPLLTRVEPGDWPEHGN